MGQKITITTTQEGYMIKSEVDFGDIFDPSVGRTVSSILKLQEEAVRKLLIDAGWIPPREYCTPHFGATLRRLTEAAHDRTRFRTTRQEVLVPIKDIQEILYQFDRIDDELRNKHYQENKENNE